MATPERIGGVDKIVGACDPQDESLVKEDILIRMLSQETFSYERGATPEEEAIIQKIFDFFPEFLKEYSSAPIRSVFPEQVHVVDEKSDYAKSNFKSTVEKAKKLGHYDPESYRIEILSLGNNYLDFAKVLVHELVHAYSFYSVNLEYGDSDSIITPRRTGLSIHEKGSSKEVFFKFMNEAVTEELTKRFCERYFPQIDQLKKLFDDYKKRLPPLPDKSSSVDSIINELRVPDKALHSYVNERLDLMSFIELLYNHNKRKFSSIEEVFKLFTQAMLGGEMLPLARLIKNNLGDEYFRKWAGRTKKESPKDMLRRYLR